MGFKINHQQNDISQGPWAWIFAWQVLSSERCQPLFSMLGIPPNMASNPACLCDASQQAWQVTAIEGLPGIPESLEESGFDEAYAEAFWILLDGFFEKLTDGYGDTEASDLYAWTRRHFLVYEHRSWWHSWNGVFSHLGSGQRRAVPVSLSSEALSKVQGLVDARLSLECYVSTNGRINTTLAREKSPFEERCLWMPAPYNVEVDLAPTLLRIEQAECTRELWNELKRKLAPAEWQAVLEWGRKESEAQGRKLPSPPPDLD